MDEKQIRSQAAGLLGGDLPDQFDIDSNTPAAFRPADETLLGDLAEMAATRCARLSRA